MINSPYCFSQHQANVYGFDLGALLLMGVMKNGVGHQYLGEGREEGSREGGGREWRVNGCREGGRWM